MADYSTVALTHEDKARLDNIGERHLDDDNVSYRQIINYLADRFEERQEEYDYILAKAIARASSDDVKRVVTRVESDKEFVERLNDDN